MKPKRVLRLFCAELPHGAGYLRVPLTPAAVDFALRHWPQPRRRSFPLHLAARAGLPWLVLAAGTRLVVPPLPQWVSKHESPIGAVLQASSWRGTGWPTLEVGFEAANGAPLLAVKSFPARHAAAGRGEVAALATAGRSAAASGLDTPDVIEVTERSDGTVELTLEILAGTPASAWVDQVRARYRIVLDALTPRLADWHRRTAHTVTLDSPRLEQDFLRPARQVLESAVATCLERQILPLLGRDVIGVHAHRDLTMSNLLVDVGGSLALIDWEHGTVEGLPGTDLAYAAVDATLRAGAPDRVAAFEAVEGQGTADADALAKGFRSLQAASGADPFLFRLSLLGGWLHHAVNELKEGSAGAFTEIARRSASAFVASEAVD